MPTVNSMGPLTVKLPKSTGNLLALFQRHYLDFLADFYKILNVFMTMPDALTTIWYVDISVTCVANLEQIHMENICL